jgi:hypothetical protein
MKELPQFTTEQLKAMVYDYSEQVQVIQQQIKILNQEILKRRQQPEQTDRPKEKGVIEKEGV